MSHPFISRIDWSWWFRWARILGTFAGAQLVVQALNAGSGFLLIRYSPKDQYAWFTLANTLGATIAMLSDSGTTVALTSRAGDCWRESHRFADLIAAGLAVRGRLFVAIAIVAAPWTWFLLSRSGCSALVASSLIALALVAVLPTTQTTVLQIINRMRSQFRAILTSDFILAISRLGFVGVIICWPFQIALAATATAAVSQWLQYQYVRRITTLQIPWTSGDPNPDRPRIWRTIRHFSPNSVFACIQGALAPWLIGFFANVHAIADLGALTRFAIVFSIIASPIHQIVGPGYARCQSKPRLIQLTFRIIGGFLVLNAGIVTASAIFPHAFLFILGSEYAHLESELFAVVCMQALSGVNQLAWSLSMARGWVSYAWVQIPISITIQLMAVPMLNLSTIEGVTSLMIAGLAGQLIVALVVLARGLTLWHPVDQEHHSGH